MKPDPPSDFGTLAEIAGDAEAAAVLRNAIEAIPDAIALPGLRRSLVAAIDGGAIRAPARLAAAAREVLAEAGIEAEVIERPDDRPIPPTPPAKNPAPERPRKRRKRRRRSRGRAGDAAAGPGQPRQPAPRSEAPEQSAEQRADLIAAERPREVADAIRANAAWLADRIDAEALPAKWRERIVDEPLALLAWRNQAGKPRIDAGNVLLRTPTSTYPGEIRTLTEADADAADRALIDLAREVGVLVAAVDLLPDRRPRRVLTIAAGDVRRIEEANLPALAAEPLPVGEQLSLLPAVVGAAADHPALWLYDRSGQPLTSQGGGAPYPLRLFFSALLSAPLHEGRTVDLALTVRDLVADLWPNGWQRGRDLPKLREALARIDAARVRFRNADWRLVGVTAMPPVGAGLDDPVVLSVHIPAGAGRGPLILRRLLFALGVRSAPLMRAYLGAAAYSDRYGQRGGSSLRPTRPADWTRPDGERIVRPDNDPALAHLPALYAADRRRLVWGPDDPALRRGAIRERTRAARAALEALAAAGAIEIRKAPNGGWRILRADLDQAPDWTPDPKLLKP